MIKWATCEQHSGDWSWRYQDC